MRKPAPLLGDMAQRTWARWKTGDIGRIDRDLRARMAILIGDPQGAAPISSPTLPVAMLGSQAERRLRWGRSALDIMLRGEITDLIDLRAYLDAERGAW